VKTKNRYQNDKICFNILLVAWLKIQKVVSSVRLCGKISSPTEKACRSYDRSFSFSDIFLINKNQQNIHF